MRLLSTGLRTPGLTQEIRARSTSFPAQGPPPQAEQTWPQELGEARRRNSPSALVTERHLPRSCSAGLREGKVLTGAQTPKAVSGQL